MNKSNNEDMKNMQEEISDIFNAIDTTSSTFKLVYGANNFRVFFILAGIFSLIIPAGIYLLESIYGGYSLYPSAIKVILFSVIFACWLTMMVVRTKVSFRVAKELDIKQNIFTIIKELLSTKMWIAVVPVLLWAVVVPIKVPEVVAYTLLVPYIGIGVGLILNMIGVMTNEKEYTYMSFWLMIVGTILYLVNGLSNNIAYVLMFVPACFIFVIVEYCTSHRNRQ